MFMTSPCGPPECTTSWCGTAWALKLPLRKAQNCVDSCGAKWWSSWTRGRCSSPTPPSYCTCDDECGGCGLNAPQGVLQARSVSWEHIRVDDGGDMVYKSDTKVWPESVTLPGPGHVYTQSNGSIPPEVPDGPPCHVGGSWGAGWCDAWRGEKTCGSLHHLQHWSTGSCVCARTLSVVVSLLWMKDGLRWAYEEGRSA